MKFKKKRNTDTSKNETAKKKEENAEPFENHVLSFPFHCNNNEQKKNNPLFEYPFGLERVIPRPVMVCIDEINQPQRNNYSSKTSKEWNNKKKQSLLNCFYQIGEVLKFSVFPFHQLKIVQLILWFCPVQLPLFIFIFSLNIVTNGKNNSKRNSKNHNNNSKCKYFVFDFGFVFSNNHF